MPACLLPQILAIYADVVTEWSATEPCHEHWSGMWCRWLVHTPMLPVMGSIEELSTISHFTCVLSLTFLGCFFITSVSLNTPPAMMQCKTLLSCEELAVSLFPQSHCWNCAHLQHVMNLPCHTPKELFRTKPSNNSFIFGSHGSGWASLVHS